MTRTFAATSQFVPPMRAGSYYYASSPGSVGTNAALGVGTLRASPSIIHRTTTLDRIGADITVVGEAGSKLRLGIYADDGAGQPGALVLDGGQIAGDSATVQALTISITLSPGVYWWAAVVQTVTTTQPTVRTSNGWTPPIPIFSSTALPGAGGLIAGVSGTGVTGALPVTFPTTGFAATATVPRLFFRVA